MGRRWCFSTLHYEIDDPEAVFQNLVGLCTVEDETTLRSMATQDEGGRVINAEIPWSRPGYKKSKALDNTILGRIMIDHHDLLIEVNSEARAEVAKTEMETIGGACHIHNNGNPIPRNHAGWRNAGRISKRVRTRGTDAVAGGP